MADRGFRRREVNFPEFPVEARRVVSQPGVEAADRSDVAFQLFVNALQRFSGQKPNAVINGVIIWRRAGFGDGANSIILATPEAIRAVTASAVYNAILPLTDPTIPRSDGCYCPITVLAPPGTIVNCKFPPPVAGGNTETSPGITNMVFGALQHVIPDKIVAACGGTSSPFLFGGTDPCSGDLYAHFHFEGIGWADRQDLDGNHMVMTINGNCGNTPVEVFETRYPSFLVESYRLPDSGGPGAFPVGLGGERLLTVTEEVADSALLNRAFRPIPGACWKVRTVRAEASGSSGPATRTGKRSLGRTVPCRRPSFPEFASTRVTKSSRSCRAVAATAIPFSGTEPWWRETSARGSL